MLPASVVELEEEKVVFDASSVRRAARQAFDEESVRISRGIGVGRRISKEKCPLLRLLESACKALSGSSVSFTAPASSSFTRESWGQRRRRKRTSKLNQAQNEIGPLAPFSLEEFCIIADIIASCPPSVARQIYREFERPPSFASLVSMCSLSAENIWVVAHRLKRHLVRTRELSEGSLASTYAPARQLRRKSSSGSSVASKFLRRRSSSAVSSSFGVILANTVEEFRAWMIDVVGFHLAAKLTAGETAGLLSMILDSGSTLTSHDVDRFVDRKEMRATRSADNLLRQELGEVDADEDKAAAKAIPDDESRVDSVNSIIVDIFVVGSNIAPSLASSRSEEIDEVEGKFDEDGEEKNCSSDLELQAPRKTFRCAGNVSSTTALWYRLAREDEYDTYPAFVRQRVTDIAISRDEKLMIASGYSRVKRRGRGKAKTHIWMRRNINCDKGISAIAVTAGTTAALTSSIWSPPCREYQCAGVLPSSSLSKDRLLWQRYAPCDGITTCEEVIEARIRSSSLNGMRNESERAIEHVRRVLVKKCDTELRVAKLDVRKMLENAASVGGTWLTRRQVRRALSASVFRSIQEGWWQLLLERFANAQGRISVDRVMRVIGFNPIEVYEIMDHLKQNAAWNWRVLNKDANTGVDYVSAVDMGPVSSSPDAIRKIASAFTDLDTDDVGTLARTDFAAALAKTFPTFSLRNADLAQLCYRFASFGSNRVDYEKFLGHLSPTYDWDDTREREHTVDEYPDPMYIGLRPDILRVLQKLQIWLRRHVLNVKNSEAQNVANRDDASIAFQVFSHSAQASQVSVDAFVRRFKRWKFAECLSPRDITNIIRAAFDPDDTGFISIANFAAFVASTIEKNTHGKDIDGSGTSGIVEQSEPPDGREDDDKGNDSSLVSSDADSGVEELHFSSDESVSDIATVLPQLRNVPPQQTVSFFESCLAADDTGCGFVPLETFYTILAKHSLHLTQRQSVHILQRFCHNPKFPQCVNYELWCRLVLRKELSASSTVGEAELAMRHLKRVVRDAEARGVSIDEMWESFCPDEPKFNAHILDRGLRRIGVAATKAAVESIFDANFGKETSRAAACQDFKRMLQPRSQNAGQGELAASVLKRALEKIDAFVNHLPWDQATQGAIEAHFSRADATGQGNMTPRQFLSCLAQFGELALKRDERSALVEAFLYRNRVNYAAFALRVCKFPSDAPPCMGWIRSKLWQSGTSLWFLFRPIVRSEADATVTREQFRSVFEKAVGRGALKEDDFELMCRLYAGSNGRIDADAACRDSRPTLEDVKGVEESLSSMLRDVLFVRGHAGGMRSYFEPYDWDASGTISRLRFKECCAKASLLIRDRDMHILVEFLDPKGTNRVDYIQFCGMLRSVANGGISEQDSSVVRDYFLRHGRDLIKALTVYDKKRSGFVTEEQFFRACRNIPVDPEDLRKMCGLHNAVGTTAYDDETLRFVAYEHFMKKIIRAGGPGGLSSSHEEGGAS